MCDAINNFGLKINKLYWAQEPSQQSFADSLKVYHGFMIDKISQSSGLKCLALRIAHVLTGIFAYPILGLLAGLNIGIKLLNWHLNGKKNNEKEKREIDFLIQTNTITEAPMSRIHLSFSGKGGPSKFTEFREYQITLTAEEQRASKSSILANLKMNELIDQFTDAYTQVQVQYRGNWKTSMRIIFTAPASQWPYCENPYLPKFQILSYPMQEREVLAIEQ